jgi:ribonuclease P protein component
VKKFSFPKEERLKGKDFERIFNSSDVNVYSNKYFTILVAPGKKRKVGIAVVKQVKSSVERNRIKRILREIYRINKHKIKEKINFIIIGKKDIINENYKNIEASYISLLRKSKLINV